MAEKVFAAARFIETCRRLAEFPLSAYIRKIDREELREVFDLSVDPTNIGVQKLRDILLKKIRVGDKDATHLEMNDEGPKETFGQRRRNLDEGEIGTNSFEMPRIDSNLPLFRKARKARILEADLEDLFDNGGDPVFIPRLHYLDANRRDQVKDGEGVLKLRFSKNIKGLVDKMLELLTIAAGEDTGIEARDLMERSLVNRREEGSTKDMRHPVDPREGVSPGLTPFVFDVRRRVDVATNDLTVVG